MPSGQAWLVEVHSSRITVLPMSPIAASRASITATFVEGAISAGLAQTQHAPVAGAYTLAKYVRWLVGNYLFAGQTPGLFRQAANRFTEMGRLELAEFALKKAAEEDGHADLAHRDLQSLGLPAAKTIWAIRPPSASEFANQFRAYVELSHPVALFGFSYCLERMAIGRDDAFIQTVEAICPANTRSTRFLKVHSNVGSDEAHVVEQLAFFETLPEQDLIPIVCGVYKTAEMLGRQRLMDQALTDEEIGRRLREAGIRYSFVDDQTAERASINASL